MAKGMSRCFTKEDKEAKWLISTRIYAQYHESLGKCKLKLQYDNTSHPLEYL